jgi:phage N-6-adenine-methyltransferase
MKNKTWDAAFSSKDMCWRTPPNVFNHFNKMFNFNLDAAASESNALCPNYYTKEDDALSQSWKEKGSKVWVNPPYGREIKDWIKKCEEESKNGCLVAALIFARTDTRWWHEHIMGKAILVYLIKGRIKFLTSKGEKTNSAPAPSCLVVWAPHEGANVFAPVFQSTTIP